MFDHSKQYINGYMIILNNLDEVIMNFKNIFFSISFIATKHDQRSLSN